MTKKSNRTKWLILSIFAIVLIGICIIFGMKVYRDRPIWQTEYLKTLNDTQNVYFYISFAGDGEHPELKLMDGDKVLSDLDSLGSSVVDHHDGTYGAYIYFLDLPAGELRYSYNTKGNTEFNVVPVTWYLDEEDDNLRSLDYGGYVDKVEVVKYGTQFSIYSK